MVANKRTTQLKQRNLWPCLAALNFRRAVLLVWVSPWRKPVESSMVLALNLIFADWCTWRSTKSKVATLKSGLFKFGTVLWKTIKSELTSLVFVPRWGADGFRASVIMIILENALKEIKRLLNKSVGFLNCDFKSTKLYEWRNTSICKRQCQKRLLLYQWRQ